MSVIIGDNSAETLTGTADDDLIEGLGGNDTITGGGGEDAIDGGTGHDRISGGARGDALSGFNGNDRLLGQSGDDILTGGAGADTLNGGSGFDSANYANSFDAVVVSLASGRGFGGQAEGDRLSGIEGVTGSIYADRLIGNDANNHLYGQIGDDTLNGGAGNDKLDGGFGDDVLAGGAGADRFVFRPSGGDDRVLGFGLGDRIDVAAYDFDNFAEVMSHAEQVGGNTVFDFHGGADVTLVNVQKSSLDAGDFVI